MKRKIYIIYGLILLLSSCVIPTLIPWRIDKLQFYKTGYSPNIDSRIKLNGFYYLNDTSEITKQNFSDFKNVNPVTPIFFYEDGSFHYCSTYPNMDSLKIWINTNHHKKGTTWGFYVIEKDSIKIECITTDFTGAQSATRTEICGNIQPDGTIVFQTYESKNSIVKTAQDTLGFEEFNWKPDQNDNWLKEHWKYKIK